MKDASQENKPKTEKPTETATTESSPTEKPQKQKTTTKTKSAKTNKTKMSQEQLEDMLDAQVAQTKTEEPKLKNSDILNHIYEQSVVFRDQNNDAFIAPHGDGTQIYRISSKNRMFRAWLTSFIRKEFKVPAVKGRRLDDLTQALESTALDEDVSARYPLGLRTVFREADRRRQISQDELWYDMGRSAIRVTKDDWFFVACPPILFRRFDQQLPQVVPEKDGNLTELANFVNLTDRNDILLFLVFTVSAFIPGYPRPLCLLYGTQGAGKSTPGRLLKRLIDPTSVEGTVLPSNNEDFVRIAGHHALLVFDNISSIKASISDALARVSTGDTFSKRALFTDDDDVVYRLQRPVMLNGINQVISQSDLLDRSILLEMRRIDSAKMKTEKDFWREFEEQKPLILGAIFDTISKAMKKFPTVELNELPRMADFAKWGYAIADSIDGFTGQDFIDAYTHNVRKQHDEAIESSAVGLAVYLFFSDENVSSPWTGTATQLVRQIEEVGMAADIAEYEEAPETAKEINTIVSGSLWPKDPEWFMRRLNYVLPDLETRGIKLRTYRDNKQHRRMLEFTFDTLKKRPLDSSAISTNNSNTEGK